MFKLVEIRAQKTSIAITNIASLGRVRGMEF